MVKLLCSLGWYAGRIHEMFPTYAEGEKGKVCLQMEYSGGTPQPAVAMRRVYLPNHLQPVRVALRSDVTTGTAVHGPPCPVVTLERRFTLLLAEHRTGWQIWQWLQGGICNSDNHGKG